MSERVGPAAAERAVAAIERAGAVSERVGAAAAGRAGGQVGDPANGPAGGGPGAPDSGRMSGRRQLSIVLLAGVAGAALVLWATSHDWVVQVTPRPAPLGPLREARTGAVLLPWLTALGWAALGGSGALLATRRAGRIAVGVVLAACGLGVLAGVGYVIFGVAGAAIGAPLLAALGALPLLGSGLAAIRYGGRWPVMGARYDSPATAVPGVAGVPGGGPAVPGGAAAERRTAAPGRAADDRTGTAGDPPADLDLWKALDRGEDPTVGPGED